MGGGGRSGEAAIRGHFDKAELGSLSDDGKVSPNGNGGWGSKRGGSLRVTAIAAKIIVSKPVGAIAVAY